jgi:hypothetical protein
MKCAHARRLFGAYWDDHTTQAEREWIESHFAVCPSCRNEYDELTQVLEWTATLPRVEPVPDLVERALSAARRATPAPDRVAVAGVRWVPVTAAVALLMILGLLASPWVGLGPGPRMAKRTPAEPALREPELVRGDSPPSAGRVPSGPARDRSPATTGAPTEDPLAAAPDSLFNHSEDVEFILDPVTLRRGRATVTHLPAGVQGERAVISF